MRGFGANHALKGPNFWNDLEAAGGNPSPHGRQDPAERSKCTPIRKHPRMLLVDNDSDVSRFLTSWLEKYGIEVDYAINARQAFRMACRDEPVVIVTDYFMPNGDAQYLLAKLRTTAATANIPVIVLSGREARRSDNSDPEARDLWSSRRGANPG